LAKITVDKELLLKVAKNARINLTEEELKKFLPQFREILEAFSKIDEVDVSNEAPAFHPVEVRNVMRKDKTEKCLPREEALSLTKHRENGYFKGPKVL
jgi:aspartyl-tRNA(Asn)/glutamyl-tRNA(Gln) amidotransferase subunit C